jgi:hypothetical protein
MALLLKCYSRADNFTVVVEWQSLPLFPLHALHPAS